MTTTTTSRPVRDWWSIIIPALLAYVPLLLTQPGQVGADTKSYLYLDPGRLLADAPYIWDSQIGLGTVTHQNIGYLWPMGPFYWLLDTVGLPDWAAQRLWLGTLMFAAAMGVRYLVRTIAPGGYATRRGAVLVACTAYMLSPYLLEYSARISVILLPWAALPWLLALTAKSLRHGGWRYPAWFALVVLTVGGINATALLLVGLGPLLWVVNAVWFQREVTWRQAWPAVLRIGVLTALTSLWWMAGLALQGRYGLPILRYTETYKTVAEVSTAPEALRGLGYWFFYGNDKLGPWVEPSATYTQRIPVLALSYALPLLSLLSAVLIRWRHRAFFLLLIGVGTLTVVGSHPWDDSSPLGAAFKAFTRTDAGLSMRSTPRAAPLLVLAMALFLGAGVAAVGRRLPRFAVPVSALVTLLVLGNVPTLWTGEMVSQHLRRPEEIPSDWSDAIAYVDGQDRGTRVLELPGSDFASYRWGNTVDPITPGLTDRGYVGRELFQWGSAPSADLLNAFDRRLHEDAMDPEAVATVARLMGVGDIVLRADLQYERFRTARPRQMWELLLAAEGLEEPIAFGPVTWNVAGPEQTMLDEIELGGTADLADPPTVSVFPVADPMGIIRTQSAERPLLLSGDGDGIVDAASMSLLDPRQAIFSSAGLAGDPDTFALVYGSDAELLITDTNRKRAKRWGTLRETTGYTERAGVGPDRYDPGDQRLELFPDADDTAFTVSEQRGGVLVTATDYGNPITYTANDRATNAVDGDPLTAWRVHAVDDPIGQRLTIHTDEPVTADQVGLLQPVNLVRNRWITRARLRFDGGDPVDIDLAESSRVEPGQVVPFPARTFSELTIEVLDTNIGRRPRYDGLSGVGFAEVTLPGVRVVEVVRVPTDLLDRAGASSLEHALGFLFTRLRSNPAEPVRTDEEEAIVRVFAVPTPRSFSVQSQARLSAFLPDETIDALLGVPDASQGGITASSYERLPGSLERRAHAAVDGDLTTHWTSRFLDPVGQHLDLELGSPATFDHLDLAVVADGRHSVPTRLFLVVDGDHDNPITVDLAHIPDAAEVGAATEVRVDLGRTITATSLGFYVDAVRETATRDWYSNEFVTMPVAIAELGIPGVVAPPVPDQVDSGCRNDLLSIDEQPIPLRVTGTSEAAIARDELVVSPCGDNPEGVVSLAAGEHVVRTSLGRVTGWDLDRMALQSAPGGAATGSATDPDPTMPPGPPVRLIDEGPVSYRVEVDTQGEPFWLALGQSWNEGWQATMNGVDLGPPTMINGYANGWYVDAGDAGPVTISMQWTPQRVVWVFLAISALGVVLCLWLALAGRRPPVGRRAAVPAEPDLDPALALPWDEAPSPLPSLAAAVGGVAMGVFAFANLPVTPWSPVLAVAVGAASYAAYRAARGRPWLGLIGVASLSLAYLYIVQSQWRHQHVSDFVWPKQFGNVHLLGLLAVLLLLGEALRELLAARGSRRGPPNPDPPVPPSIS